MRGSAVLLLVPPVIALGIAIAACESSDPDATRVDAGPPDAPSVEPGSDAQPGADGSDGPAACGKDEVLNGMLNDAMCARLGDDYFPGRNAPPWPVCISDDDAYHPFNPSIGTAARVAAFETISQLLGFGSNKVPNPQEFVDAKQAYLLPEGIESRVARREDEHYPPAAKACRDMTPDELAQNADRCVGPARMQPLLNKAFADGAAGVEPQANAARIEATLLWFLYLSTYKEAVTCTTTQADCDSSYAYYTGDEARGGAGKGLARYVKARSTQVHDRIWDGILAVRCWRDQDNPTGPASNFEMRDRALRQLDRALVRGVAVILRTRLERRKCDATWSMLRVLGPVLEREARVRNPSAASALMQELAKANPADVDEKAALGALDTLFPCP